ncbi:MAG: imidazole glycerol phosphate synthase subunit HisH [Candidatus Omnitrophota bacterium]
MQKIVVVDYGMGNLLSVENIFRKFGVEVIISSNKDEIAAAEKLVLPGVGACKVAMQELKTRGLVEAICKFINTNRPYLGICLGLQLLFEYSEEGGGVSGLGILKGNVRRLKPDVKIPHMGWNQIKIKNKTPLLKNIQDLSFVYFVHSYYVLPVDQGIIMTTTTYGGDFASSVNRDNLYGTQFHPEKSQHVGMQIIKNFVEI